MSNKEFYVNRLVNTSIDNFVGLGIPKFEDTLNNIVCAMIRDNLDESFIGGIIIAYELMYMKANRK